MSTSHGSYSILTLGGVVPAMRAEDLYHALDAAGACAPWAGGTPRDVILMAADAANACDTVPARTRPASLVFPDPAIAQPDATLTGVLAALALDWAWHHVPHGGPGTIARFHEAATNATEVFRTDGSTILLTRRDAQIPGRRTTAARWTAFERSLHLVVARSAHEALRLSRSRRPGAPPGAPRSSGPPGQC